MVSPRLNTVEKVLNFLTANNTKGWSSYYMIHHLGVEYHSLKACLEHLLKEGKIQKFETSHYVFYKVKEILDTKSLE